MAATIEDLLGQSRTKATNEERVVLALETIADSLTSLVRLLPAGMPQLRDEIVGRAARNDSVSDAEAAFENEGGSLSRDLIADLDITHSVLDQYTVGKYHYTNLVDAIAQAKRSQRHPDG